MSRTVFLLIVEEESEALDVSVHSSHEHALTYLAGRCRGWWDELPHAGPGEALPAATAEAVKAFFEEAPEWSYQLDVVPIDPEPQGDEGGPP
jgi:hypothetical protein